MELHAAWSTQREGLARVHARRPRRVALLSPLWRLRAHMAFLIDNLQYYLQVDVLELHWHALMASVENCSRDFEQLTTAHEAALAALHSQCFLSGKSHTPSVCPMVTHPDAHPDSHPNSPPSITPLNHPSNHPPSPIRSSTSLPSPCSPSSAAPR